MDIAAVVVTFNRETLLNECLEAIFKQSYHLSAIYVIDNASTDDTEKLCKQILSNDMRFQYIKMDQNIGGAGGFNYGLKKAYNDGHDLIWIMDDDSIPNIDALERLIANKRLQDLKQWGFVCSNIRWIDGTPCQMNIPTLSENWNELVQYNLIPVKSCSFVSVLITREAIQKCGLPIKEFFIWVDDTEFTSRISREYNCYFVTDSLVTHKIINNQYANILTEEGPRIERYFYEYRNRYYLNRTFGKVKLRKYRKNMMKVVVKILRSPSEKKYLKIKTIIKGYIKGINFKPNIEYVN